MKKSLGKMQFKVLYSLCNLNASENPGNFKVYLLMGIRKLPKMNRP